MRSKLRGILIAMLFFGLSVPNLTADVTRRATTTLIFKGAMGSAMKLLGGSRPITTVNYYKGSRLRSDILDKRGNVDQTQIIDLDREVFISIDHKKKAYTEMTFDEWRKMMDEQMEQVKENSRGKGETTTEWSFKVDVSRTGDTKEVSGYAAEEMILTLMANAAASQEGEAAQGGITVTSNLWMAKSVKGADEMERFQKNLQKKLDMASGSRAMASMMEAIAQNNPQLAEAAKKLEKESAKLSGTPLETHQIYEMKGSADKKSEGTGASGIGGARKALGGLLKKAAKKATQSKSKSSASQVLMESEMKIESIDTASVAASRFEIPGDYRKKEIK